MSKILTMNGSGIENFGRGKRLGVKKNLTISRVVLGVKKRTNVGIGCGRNENMSFKKICSFFVFFILFFGCFHLYQINDLATKGYEVRKIENQIAGLKKINEKNRIQEVELRSMYNIEKEVPNLDLVASKDIIYLDINGSIAMK